MPSEVGRPIPYVDQVAIDFPELTIVCGHIGYPWTEEMIAVATKHKNVYIDTSAYTVRRYPPAPAASLKTPGRDKVLFGTNWPMIAPRKALEGLADLAMTDEVAAAFLWGNASRVYRLAAPTAAISQYHRPSPASPALRARNQRAAESRDDRVRRRGRMHAPRTARSGAEPSRDFARIVRRVRQACAPGSAVAPRTGSIRRVISRRSTHRASRSSSQFGVERDRQLAKLGNRAAAKAGVSASWPYSVREKCARRRRQDLEVVRC